MTYMGFIGITALFVLVAVAAWRYGVDSRSHRDRADRYWWPAG